MDNHKLLSDLGIELRNIKTSGKTTCPKCSHTRKKKTDHCLSVNIVDGLYKCHNCGWFGSVNVNSNKEKKSYSIPVFNNRTDLSEKSVKFFQSRCINQDTLNHFKITNSRMYFPALGGEHESIDFNYFRKGSLVNVKYRGPKKSFMLNKGSELIFYNLDSIVGQETVYLVEGEIDALSVHQVGFKSVVSVPNGATVSGNSNLEYLDNCIDSFSSAKKIIIATDNDDPGRNLRRELTRRLGAHRCFKVDFGDLKDSNEVLMHKGPEALYEILSDYREMPIDGVISVSDVWDELEGFFKTGLSRGDTTGTIREFDKLVSFVPGHTMAITGVPNHGKSLLSNQIMCSLSVKHGWKWAVFSPEHKPLSLYLAKLCEMLLGKRMKMGAGFTDREKELAKNFLNDHFFFIEPEDGDNTLESIISKAESLVFRKGIRGFILDPWNKIDHNQGKNQSETQYISKALDDIIYFGQKNSVFNIIVAHPTKVKKKSNSPLYEVPTMYDIAGSANFFNKVDWGVTFYRNFESGLNEIYIQKSKWEHLGKIGSLYCKFNPANGRLGDEMDDPDYSNWLKPKEEQIDITFTRDSFQDLPPVQVVDGEEEEIPF